jgi:hypothetical protein
MLDMAQKYTEELKLKLANISYDLKYQFYTGGWSTEYQPSKDNWNKFEFVSVDSKGNVIGYMSYDVDRNSNLASCLHIINFSDNKITFGRDVSQVIDDIFIKYQFRKLEYGVYVGNPIENTYDKLTTRYGGKIVGTKQKTTKLLDGNLYDFKMYELFREEYIGKSNK